MAKFTYTVEECSQDTRTYTIESEVKLTEEDIIDFYLVPISPHSVETLQYKPKVTVQFKGTNYGDDTRVEISGDVKEEEK